MTPGTALSWHYSGAYRDHDLTGCALIVVQKKSPSARRSFVGLLERPAGIEKSAVDQLALAEHMLFDDQNFRQLYYYLKKHSP